MLDRLLDRCGGWYVLVMMLITRPLCLLGGALTIYFVSLSMALPYLLLEHLILFAAVWIALSTLSTVLLAQYETRTLRRVIEEIRAGKIVSPEDGDRAGREAATFSSLHHWREGWLVPLTTVVPINAWLWFVDSPPLLLLLQIGAAGFVGISAVLLMTFFAAERWMATCTTFLLANGVVIDFRDLPRSHLRRRMNVCFGLTLAITALMIGSLANQRAFEIVQNPATQTEAVASLREHTVMISIAAVAVGLLLSHFLSSSVSTRVDDLVAAMQRVKSGRLDERLMPVGNDEIDHLAREFNTMVEQLNRNDAMIRELNATLEEKVKVRTRQLMRSKKTLQRSFRKLRETDRLKTEFFSNVSHELRTPLTMILAPVQRLLEQADTLPARDRSLLDVVRLNGLRLLELINQLLEFSRVGAGKEAVRPESLQLNRLVESLVRSAEPLAEQRGVQLTARLDATLPLTSADPEKLETVIRNLVSNALKFTPQGGAVHVETRLQNDRLHLSVADTGIGIKPEDHSRIFDRFVQIDGSRSRAFSGTGLGLALARELIELHGGKIGLDSELGRGSTFWIELPVVKPLVPVAATISTAATGLKSTFAELQTFPVARNAPAAPASADDRSPLILIVDDTPEMRFLIGDVLSDHYRIELAADGFEALEAMERRTPDLVISDVMMPGLDGYELCHRVRADERWCKLPFVLLTARAETSMKIEGLQCGADDYLVKPFDSEELRARVRSLLRVRDLYRQIEVKNRDLEATLRDVKAMQSQLVHSEKMNSIGQLVAGVAHEINNAINAVYNGIQPLARKASAVRELLIAREESGKLDVEVDRGLTRISSLAEVILHGAERATRIVQDLKTFSHPGAEIPQWFDVNQSLDVCVNLLGHELKDRITVHRDYGESGRMFGPLGELNQVFMNLLNNARQAISGPGDIFVRTRLEGDWLTVTIRDTGCGIPEAVRNRIFDPFFTTKDVGVGTGLGLSISCRIVEGLGGNLRFVCPPEGGTEFTITIPADERDESAAANAVKHAETLESVAQ